MNVRSLFSNTKKRSDVFNWFKAKKISIVCFQETHSTKDVAVKWEDEWVVHSSLVMVIVKVPE
jgi:exonuclease III